MTFRTGESGDGERTNPRKSNVSSACCGGGDVMLRSDSAIEDEAGRGRAADAGRGRGFGMFRNGLCEDVACAAEDDDEVGGGGAPRIRRVAKLLFPLRRGCVGPDAAGCLRGDCAGVVDDVGTLRACCCCCCWRTGVDEVFSQSAALDLTDCVEAVLAVVGGVAAAAAAVVAVVPALPYREVNERGGPTPLAAAEGVPRLRIAAAAVVVVAGACRCGLSSLRVCAGDCSFLFSLFASPLELGALPASCDVNENRLRREGIVPNCTMSEEIFADVAVVVVVSSLEG